MYLLVGLRSQTGLCRVDTLTFLSMRVLDTLCFYHSLTSRKELTQRKKQHFVFAFKLKNRNIGNTIMSSWLCLLSSKHGNYRETCMAFLAKILFVFWVFIGHVANCGKWQKPREGTCMLPFSGILCKVLYILALLVSLQCHLPSSGVQTDDLEVR